MNRLIRILSIRILTLEETYINKKSRKLYRLVLIRTSEESRLSCSPIVES